MRQAPVAPVSSLGGAFSSPAALLNLGGMATYGLAVHPSAMRGPVTIADLTRDGKQLEIGCLGCGRHVYVDAAGVGLPNDLQVPNVAARLACSGCGAINQPTWHPIWARPDAGHTGCCSGRSLTCLGLHPPGV